MLVSFQNAKFGIYIVSADAPRGVSVPRLKEKRHLAPLTECGKQMNVLYVRERAFHKCSFRKFKNQIRTDVIMITTIKRGILHQNSTFSASF